MLTGQTGKVKWWDEEQGFGFITQPSGQDVFVHHSDIRVGDYPTLQEGQFVNFDVTQERQGLRAHNVRTPGSVAQPTHVRANTAPTQVKIFHTSSGRKAEYEINNWAEETGHRIISASLTRNVQDGSVTSLVVYSMEQSQ